MSDLYSLSQKKDELVWKLNRLNDIIERDEMKIQEIDALSQRLELYNQQMNETMTRRNLIHDLIEDVHDLSVVEDQIYETEQLFNDLNKKYVSILENLNDLKQQQLKIYAGLLAHDLKDDVPCPVCGSLHHPHLAKTLDVETNETQLEETTKQYRLIRDQRDEMSITLEGLKNRRIMLDNQIIYLKNQLNIEDDLSKEFLTNMLYKIDRLTQSKLKQYKKDENELIYLKKLSKSVKDSVKLKEQYEQEIEQLSLKMASIQ